MVGAIAILTFTKYALSHTILLKEANPESLFPFPITKVKIPSALEVSINFSVYIFVSMVLEVRIETIA